MKSLLLHQLPFIIKPENTVNSISADEGMDMAERRKAFQELEFKDAFMFAAMLQDAELCRKTLERILEFPIRKVVVQSEHSLFVNSDYHGIRMDVYADDETGTVYDVEMQTRQDSVDELSKRSRYYQSQMDLGLSEYRGNQ